LSKLLSEVADVKRVVRSPETLREAIKQGVETH
jgi:hypothetical protein